MDANIHQKRRLLLQFIKYATVGVFNTLVTLGVIFLCKSIFGVNEYASNAVGYIAGLINSFFWNRNWVFKAKSNSLRQATQFVVGFLLCYAVQLAVVWLLTDVSSLGKQLWVLPFNFVLSGYGVATLIGMIVYTLSNYLYNRLVTFRI